MAPLVFQSRQTQFSLPLLIQFDPVQKELFKRTLKEITIHVQPNPALGVLESIRDCTGSGLGSNNSGGSTFDCGTDACASIRHEPPRRRMAGSANKIPRIEI